MFEPRAYPAQEIVCQNIRCVTSPIRFYPQPRSPKKSRHKSRTFRKSSHTQSEVFELARMGPILRDLTVGREALRPESSQEGRTEDTQGTGLEAREASGKRKGPRAWKWKAGVLRASHLRGITSCVPPPTHTHTPTKPREGLQIFF